MSEQLRWKRISQSAQFKNRSDVGMVQPGKRQGFFAEALSGILISQHARGISKLSARWKTLHPGKALLRYYFVFFNGGRALSSVLSRNEKLRKDFNEKSGNRYRTVRLLFASSGAWEVG